jgi:hypothetical protein
LQSKHLYFAERNIQQTQSRSRCVVNTAFPVDVIGLKIGVDPLFLQFLKSIE